VVEAFKTFKAVTENKLGKRIHKVVTDNAWELSMGKVHRFCKAEGIKPNTTVPYHTALNGVAGHTIGVLTNAMCMMLHSSGLLKSLGQKLSIQQHMFAIGCRQVQS